MQTQYKLFFVKFLQQWQMAIAIYLVFYSGNLL